MQCKLQQEKSVIGIPDIVFIINFFLIALFTFVNEIHIRNVQNNHLEFLFCYLSNVNISAFLLTAKFSNFSNLPTYQHP